MRIRLIDIDSKISNLALVKLSAHHKARGDPVAILASLEEAAEGAARTGGRARPPLWGAALMEADGMKRGDDVFPTIMDEGLVIETCLPATTDEWAFYRRVYRIERHGRSWWRGTA